MLRGKTQFNYFDRSHLNCVYISNLLIFNSIRINIFSAVIICFAKAENLVNNDAFSRLSNRDELYMMIYRTFLIVTKILDVYLFLLKLKDCRVMYQLLLSSLSN